MTPEKAIEIVKSIMQSGKEQRKPRNNYELEDVGEYEDPELPDGCIRRQLAIDVVQRILGDCQSWDVVGALVKLPAAKKGHWIKDKFCGSTNDGLSFQYYDSPDYMMCSECFHSFNYYDNCTELFNYCPNCGAYMRDE